MDDGITVLDPQGCVVFANEMAARMLGTSSVDELLGTSLLERLSRSVVLDESGRPVPTTELPGHRASQDPRPWMTLRFRPTRASEERWSLVKTTPIRDERGHLELVLHVWHEITRERRAAEINRFLAEASAILTASVVDLRNTLSAIVRLAVPEFADWCLVDVLEKDGHLRRVEVAHVDPEKLRVARELSQRYPPRRDLPRGVYPVLESGRSVLMEEVPDEMLRMAAHDEEHLRILRELGLRSYMIVPLAARGKALGALTFVYAESQRVYGPLDLAMAEDLGRRAGLAMENARLFEETRAAREDSEELHRRARFVAEAGRLLASSLDYETTLASVAHLAVPHFADWCAVHLVEENGQVRRVEIAHTDPVKRQLGLELERRYPPRPETPSVVDRVAGSGRAELLPEFPDAELERVAHDAEHLQLLRALGLRSSMVVPLTARGRTLGTLTFVRAETVQLFGEADLAMAEELGQRAGLAIDNARLHRELQLMNEQLEKRVRERTAQLEEANRELESFSYSVSHDLRAPVRHIDGFAELLEKHAGRSLDARAQHLLGTIRTAARQAGQLVDDLLSFSRMGRAEVRQTPLDMSALVAALRRELEPEIAGRAVEWAVAPLPQVHGDPAMIRLAVRNLLANALKFTQGRQPARIEVGATRSGDEVIFFVRDNGAGFDMRHADKLFGVFQRLHKAEEFSGTGIGLASVRRIVHRHGGRTWAEGTPNQGATFFFSLPDPVAPPESR